MNTFRDDPDGDLNQRATHDNERYVGALQLQQQHKPMNVNDIKAELAKLEPEAEAAWIAFKQLEDQAVPLRDKWSALYRRCEQLRGTLELLEPKGEPEPAQSKQLLCESTKLAIRSS